MSLQPQELRAAPPAELPHNTTHASKVPEKNHVRFIPQKRGKKRQDSQFLPDAPQPGLSVSQLNCQVLLVFTRQAAGGAWCGVWTGELAGAGRVLRLEVVPLLCQVHNQLEDREKTGICGSLLLPGLAQCPGPDSVKNH